MTDFGKLRATAVQVSEGLSASLERMIVSGELPAGERLPSERALAETLGVSRASLREAMRELELKGLVDRRPGRGTVVLDVGRTDRGGGLFERLDATERSLREVMDLRAAIEPPIAARAALRASPREIEGFRAIVAQMREETSVAGTTALDVRFHYEIARSTHNPLLVRMIEVVAEWVDRSRRAGAQSKRRRAASIAAHEAIIERIADRDPEGASREMAKHIETVNQLIVEAGRK